MIEAPNVVIVGAGAGGGAAAWRLTTLGLSVLLLDAGPSFEAATDFKLSQEDWEQSFPHKPGSQGVYEVAPGQPLADIPQDLRSWNHIKGLLVHGHQRTSFGYHHVRGVGGSSLQFTGEAHRLNPLSMRMKTDFGVAHDWPVSYAELEKYWLMAEKLTGVAGPAVDGRCPRSEPYPWLAHRLSFASEHLARSLTRLGWGYQQNSLAVLPVAHDGRPGCNHCGGCLRGCQIRDKGSIDVTYLRLAMKTGRLKILPNTEVLQIETKGDRVESVLVHTRGQQRKIKTSVLVLACGAIQTPRLMLNSVSSSSPAGLCNEEGWVGKNFMETLLWTSSAMSNSDLGSHRGLPVDWVCWDFNKPNAIPGVIGGVRFGPSMAESDLVGPVAYAQRVIKGWGLEHKKAMRQQFGRALSVAGLGESLPNPGSYVSLSEKKDAVGLPMALIRSRVDEMALDRLRFMAETCRKILRASGVGPVFEEFSSADAFSSTHVFGTCRMSSSAKTGVVDAYCKSFRWPNLYIVDGSVFPSSGGGESPGLTIQALALRASDALYKNHRG